MTIALVGGGTTGLCVAYYLTTLGYKDIDIHEKEPVNGGRLASDPKSKIDHCERINPNLYFNLNNIYKQTGVSKNLKTVQIHNSAENLSLFSIIKFIFLMGFWTTTFMGCIKRALTSKETQTFTNFINYSLYINNLSLVSKSRGVFFFMLYVFRSYIPLSTPTTLTAYSIVDPLKDYLQKRGCQFINTSNVTAISTIGNKYQINNKVYDYVFVCCRLNDMFQIRHNISLDLQSLKTYNIPSNYNAPTIYHYKLNKKLSNDNEPQLWIDLNFTYSVLYKPQADYLLLSIHSDYINDDPLYLINTFLPVDDTVIDSVVKKNNSTIEDRVYVGQQIPIDHLCSQLKPHVFIAGTYTDQYLSESGEAAAVSAKLAVYKFVFEHQWWYKLLHLTWITTSVYNLGVTLNLI